MRNLNHEPIKARTYVRELFLHGHLQSLQT